MKKLFAVFGSLLVLASTRSKAQNPQQPVKKETAKPTQGAAPKAGAFDSYLKIDGVPSTNNGANSVISKGANPAFTKGANPAFAKGANPAFAKGANPAFTKGANPAFLKGAHSTFKGAQSATNQQVAPRHAPPPANNQVAPRHTGPKG